MDDKMWDGEEKRHYPGLEDHMAGLRRDVAEMKMAMRDVAVALRQLAVLEEKHSDTRELVTAATSKLERYADELNMLERRVSFFRGAVWLIGFVITLGAAGIGTAIVRGFDAVTAANTHLQVDVIRTPQDVIRAYNDYRNQSKGMQ